MSDKPVGMLVAAAIVAPLCLLCLAGPALFVFFAGSVAAWFTGTTALLAVCAAMAAAMLVWRFYFRRRSAGDESVIPTETRLS